MRAAKGNICACGAIRKRVYFSADSLECRVLGWGEAATGVWLLSRWEQAELFPVSVGPVQAHTSSETHRGAPAWPHPLPRDTHILLPAATAAREALHPFTAAPSHPKSAGSRDSRSIPSACADVPKSPRHINSRHCGSGSARSRVGPPAPRLPTGRVH